MEQQGIGEVDDVRQEVVETIVDPEQGEGTFVGEEVIDPGTDLTGWEGAIPTGLKVPPYTQVHLMRFPAELTGRPDLGEQTLVLWALTVKEENLAYRRSQGDQLVAIDELTKGCVRAINGHPVDWTKGGMLVNKLWGDLPIRCINMVRNWYTRNHTLTKEQQADFFAKHFAVRTAVVG